MDWPDPDKVSEPGDLLEDDFENVETEEFGADRDEDPRLIHEAAWQESGAPFMRDELAWSWQDQASTRRERERERQLDRFRARTLSAGDLREMRNWDRECYFADLHVECDIHGCQDARVPGARHEAGCRWNAACTEELMLHGLALHKADPNFWTRLRKLGVTPDVVADANAILNRDRVFSVARVHRAPVFSLPRQRTRARARGRRAAPARRRQAVSRGSPDESGEPEPAGGHELRHLTSPRVVLP